MCGLRHSSLGLIVHVRVLVAWVMEVSALGSLHLASGFAFNQMKTVAFCPIRTFASEVILYF